MNAALNRLWTKYASQPGYVKAEWMELDRAISALGDGQGSPPSSTDPESPP